MKKITIIAILSILFITTSIHATVSRIAGLGIQPWMIDEDDTHIWFNIARLSDHKNIIWGELGSTLPTPLNVNFSNQTTLSNQWGAVSYGFKLGLPSVIGLAIARPYWGRVGTVGQAIGDVPSLAPFMPRLVDVTGASVLFETLTPRNKFDLGYSMALSDKIKLGAAVNFACDYDNRDFSYDGAATSGTVTNNRESSEINFSIGTLLSDIGPISNLDIAFALGLPSVKNTFKEIPKTAGPGIERDDHELKTDRAMNLGLFTRAAIDLLDTLKLLILLNYGSSNLPNTFIGRHDANADGDYNDPYEFIEQKRTQRTSNISLGSSLNKKINDKTLLISALGISLDTTENSAVQSSSAGITMEEYKTETTALTIPVNIALERVISRVFTARLGVRYDILSIQTTKVTDPDAFDALGRATIEDKKTTVVDLSGQQAMVSLGLGVNITNSLKLDAVIRQQLLFTGTYLISGVPETLATLLTVTYKF